MNELTSDLQVQQIAKIATLEAKVENVEKVITDLSILKENLIELKLMSKQQMQFNERQAKKDEEMTKTLTGIQENLHSLNCEMKEVRVETKKIIGRVEHLEDEKSDNKEIKIEETKSRTEIIKQKYIVIGLGVSGMLSTLAIVVPIILKK